MNKITKIFNNIGFYCSINNDYFIPNNVIKSYQLLDLSSVGYYIPYLVRNFNDNLKWEIGIGQVEIVNNSIVVKRIEIFSSSNSDKLVNFSGNNNEFYLFVNNTNFNTSFNNVILKSDHFNIDNTTAIYIVDNSLKTIEAVLPPSVDSRNLVIDIKALSSNHNVQIRNGDGSILRSTNDCIRLVSDGQSWYILNSIDSSVTNLIGSLSADTNFSAQSVPAGDEYSFQYRDGNDFAGSRVYWSSGESNNVLLGSDNESTAHTILATSGNNQNTIFNQDLTNSEFKIFGSGSPNKNFWFTYDGRIGLNIPSGSRPSTLFHVVNTACSEILRLENITQCQPAKLTLYHKPPSTLSNNTICSILNLAGKDINNNQRDYAQISSFASNVSAGQGGLNLSISSGSDQQSLISGDLSSINVGYGTNRRLSINNNGSVSLTGSSIAINSNTTNTIRTPGAFISLNNNPTNNIIFSHNGLNLGTGLIQADGTLSVGDIKINNLESNKLLSIDNDKNIVGLYDLNDYFLTERDITWNKFLPRSASVCLKQVVFDVPAPTNEFSVGDQLEISTEAGLLYRNIIDIVLSDNLITELFLDQNVTTNTVNNITVLSVTKGGFLLIQKNTSGVISDSTSNILSVRPSVDTVFNTGRKNIDFTVYGTDTDPAFKIYANAGYVAKSSGLYNTFATRSDIINPILISSSGSGLNNSFSSANYDYNPSNSVVYSGVSSVGSNGRSSFYGTFDQNGNVAEWLEASNFNNPEQLVAGGSYKTSGSNNLRSINSVFANSGYDDVGFRVASIILNNDNFDVSVGLSFQDIIHANNIADTGSLVEDSSPTNYADLGVVDKNYRLGTYEITNDQYVKFLNSVATEINTADYLYDGSMSGVFGGINKTNNGLANEYTIKNSMIDKPVNFVSYLNSLRFINWLQNGAPSGVTSENIDSIINDGAYTISVGSNNNYDIQANSNRKYFLPSLNQWHKAAYFEYKDNILASGSPVITINSSSPHIVATEKLEDNNEVARQLLANVTVSGWLVVDHILVKDGVIRSSYDSLPFEPDLTQNIIEGQNESDPILPPSTTSPDSISGSVFWNNGTASPRRDGVYGEIQPPLVPNIFPESVNISCDDELLIETNNLPFWCVENGKFKGSFFY
jgi:hypothetical protein